jgi:hypothetical protein
VSVIGGKLHEVTWQIRAVKCKITPGLVDAAGIHPIGFKRHFRLVDDSQFTLSDPFARQGCIIVHVIIFFVCSSDRVLAYIKNLKQQSVGN